jgi:hypothetical protein
VIGRSAVGVDDELLVAVVDRLKRRLRMHVDNAPGRHQMARRRLAEIHRHLTGEHDERLLLLGVHMTPPLRAGLVAPEVGTTAFEANQVLQFGYVPRRFAGVVRTREPRELLRRDDRETHPATILRTLKCDEFGELRWSLESMSLHLFAGLRVRDFQLARPWYERLLGDPALFPHATEAVWTLAEDRSIYIVEHAPGAGNSVVTVFIDDLDAQVAAIAARGLEPDKQETYSNGVRKVIYRDRDGNEIGFAGAPLQSAS